jgi:hypothetical protein
VNAEAARTAEAAARGPGAAGGRDPAQWLRMSRGFSCLFWSLPLLSTGHALALMSGLEVRRAIGAALLGYLPLLCGLWMLRLDGDWAPRWGARVGRITLLAFIAMYLCPFVAWWKFAPVRMYFAVNAGAHYVAVVVLLAGLCRLAGAAARALDDTVLRREALAGLGMVLWLSGCTVAVLAWLLHGAGLLRAGAPALLAQLAKLPDEARFLFLLPYAMAAYVMWRAKEAGFRRAVRPAD